MNKYIPFEKFLLRSPLCSFDELEQILKNEEVFIKYLENKSFQEAILIASPVLFKQLKKYLNGELINEKEIEKLLYSLLRYICRMSTRCTPFGIFAGCSIGEFADETHIILNNVVEKRTRLDMYYLCFLIEYLAQLPQIRCRIKYYPNTSLYYVSDKVRYLESSSFGTFRSYNISSVDFSIYLELILEKARDGATIEDLCKTIKEDYLSEDEVELFVDQLIDNQLIIPELSPMISGDDLLQKTINLLDSLNVTDVNLIYIKELSYLLKQLDLNERNIEHLHIEIKDIITKIGLKYDENYLMQVDMHRILSKATLNSDLLKEIQSVMCFLNRISYEKEKVSLHRFKKIFYERYGEEEISLLEVLDPDLGIGYPVNSNYGNNSPLIMDFHFPSQENEINISERFGPFQGLLLRKIMDNIHSLNEIVLTDDDIIDFPQPNWDNLPPTLYTMFELLNNGNKSLMRLNFFSGSSGANLLSRFAYLNNEITSFAKEIVSKEEELLLDKVVAEIIHFPENRVGNILHHPHLHKYELLYLAISNLPSEQLIPVSDLMLSIKKGKLHIRSLRLNKEIIPRLTTAYNYNRNSTPVYKFLCDMQCKDLRSGLFFDWGILEKYLSYRPRVCYRNTILSLAEWNVEIKDIKCFFNMEENDTLIKEILLWRRNIKMPRLVLLVEGDNELFIDWENMLIIRSLFMLIKKSKYVKFREFIFTKENAVVKDKLGGTYLNQFVIALHKV